MPGENIYDWSTTAASNDTADSLINWRENQARASVNDSARSLMAAHAKNRNLQNGSITTGGTANAQTFVSGVGYTTIPTGMRVLLKIGILNTGATTLNMDSISDTAIRDQLGNALTGGELRLGGYSEFVYDGTNWILLGDTGAGGVLLGNPDIGDVLENYVQTGVLTSAVVFTITGLVLPPGDWDVYGSGKWVGYGGILGTVYTSLALDAVTLDMSSPFYTTSHWVDANLNSNTIHTPVGVRRAIVPLGSTTTIYLNGLVNHTGSTITCLGGIYARRVR